MKNLAITLIGLLLFACGEDGNPSRPYPRVRTNPVDNVTSLGAMFHAEITLSSVEIIDHGFVFSSFAFPAIDNAEAISLGPKSEIGTFDGQADHGITYGVKYFVRGYAKTKKHTVYGEVVEFMGRGSAGHKIFNFSPQEGVSTDTVTIEGKYFSSLTANNSVKFGTTAATVINSTDSTIQCIVPTLNADQDYTLSVGASGVTLTAAGKFKILAPEILSINSHEGIFGDTIIFDGKNFPQLKPHVKLTLGGIQCEILTLTKNRFSVKIPNNLTKSKNPLVAKILEVTINAGDFQIKPPQMVNITNALLTAYNNPPLIITGHNFSPIPANNKITIGGNVCNVISSSTTQITVQPSNQLIYDIEISVKDTFDIQVTVFDQSDILENKIILTYFSRWTKLKDFPGNPRMLGASCEINGKGYIGLGSKEEFDIWYKDLWEYNPTTDAWRRRSNFPGLARSKFTTLVVNSKIYIIAGITGHNSNGLSDDINEVWEFDPVMNSWTRKNDFPGGARASAFGFVINNVGYLGSGNSSIAGPKKDFWRYESNTDSWIQLNNVPHSVRGEGILSLSNGTDGYVLTENCDLNCSKRYLWKYDRLNDVWLDMPDMPERYTNVTGYYLNNKFYVQNVSSLLYEYDINSATWKGLNFRIGSRAHASSFTIGNYGYILLGQGNCHCADLSDVWKFDPSKP